MAVVDKEAMHLALLGIVAILLVATGCDQKKRFIQKSSSMVPTIQPDEEIVADMAAYESREPERWDVIIFDPPPMRGQGHIWAKRVVGLPGEKISFSNRRLIIDGQQANLPDQLRQIRYAPDIPQIHGQRAVAYPYTVPDDSYFVLGDNVSASNDSRFWGAVPRDQILGKVMNKSVKGED